jgi:hypothetical protein
MAESTTLRAEVGRLGRELGALCSGLDPDAVPLPEVTALWSAFDALERLAAGAKCRLARRVEESRSWAATGARSPAEHLAQLSGTTTGRARGALETSKALAGLPRADAAVAAGELSDQQASAIASAAGADPSAEDRLVALAKRRDLRRLREECARTSARAEDEAKRHQRLHRQRSLRTWKGPDGSWNLSVRNTPEVGAEFEAALAPLREAIFGAARLRGEHESGEAYGADALAAMVRRSLGAEDGSGTGGARGRGAAVAGGQPAPAGGAAAEGAAAQAEPTGGPGGAGASGGADDSLDAPEGAGARRAARSRRPDTKVIALIDYEALKRGVAEGGETCEIAGVGPVSVATVRSLLGDAFGAAIVTNGVDVFSVAHLGRSVSAHQRSALEARGYGCEVPGCGSATALEIDHIDEWCKTFRTTLEALAWMCRPHHQDKTYRGWRLLGPPGRRRWVAGETSGREVPGPEPPGSEPAPPDLAGAEEAVAGEATLPLFDDPTAA